MGMTAVGPAAFEYPEHSVHPVRVAVKGALRGAHRLSRHARVMVTAFGDAVACLTDKGDDAEDRAIQHDVADMFMTMLGTQTTTPVVLDRLVRMVTLGKLGLAALCEGLRVTWCAGPLLHTTAHCLRDSVRLLFKPTCRHLKAKVSVTWLPNAVLGQVQAVLQACMDCRGDDGAPATTAKGACVFLHAVVAHAIGEVQAGEAPAPAPGPGDCRPETFCRGLGAVVRAVYRPGNKLFSEMAAAYTDVEGATAAWDAWAPCVDVPVKDMRQFLGTLLVQLLPWVDAPSQ